MRARRKELGHSPRHCAVVAGMDRANWMRLERGKKDITLGTAYKVADALCIPLYKLLGE